MVKQMPTIAANQQPTIAIITAMYHEKVAVDAMMENKTTYVRYKTEGKCCFQKGTMKRVDGSLKDVLETMWSISVTYAMLNVKKKEGICVHIF